MSVRRTPITMASCRWTRWRRCTAVTGPARKSSEHERPALIDSAGRLTNPLPCEVLARMSNGAAPHILLVEDERTIREPLAQYLSRNHIRVSNADSAEAARRLLAAHAVDLILLDIMLPGEDGLSLCRSLRATAGIPIIMITARA